MDTPTAQIIGDFVGRPVSFHWISPGSKKLKLGHSDLISFLMVLAIPGDGKLGQADLIKAPPGGYLFGWTQTVLHPKGKYSLTFLVSQCITVQMNLNYIELKTKGIQ